MLAIIGGTGFGQYAGLTDLEPSEIETEFGVTYVESGLLGGKPLLFLPRHGAPPRFPPHKINYRANIDGLIEAGATKIIAVTAVGGVDESLQIPELIIPDQLIDYTYGRDHTFFEDVIHHIDLTYPYDPELRSQLIESAVEYQNLGKNVCLTKSGVYGCLQGPRLETAAEIRRLRIDGCTIVGMTAMPELALAREREIPYVGISVNVNAGAGINPEPIEMSDIEAAMNTGLGWIREILHIFHSK
jgi:5'-methylthioinosine phosphorylase